MNDLEPFFFYFSSAIAILSAIGVTLLQKTVYSVLLLVITMISLSVLFLLLGAQFVAMIQILIYAGAILVLFLLVNMLLGMEGAQSSETPSVRKFLLWLIFPVLITGELILAIHSTPVLSSTAQGYAPRFSSTVESLGAFLFSDYLLPFELTSVILLVGILGVVLLTRKNTLSTSNDPNKPLSQSKNGWL